MKCLYPDKPCMYRDEEGFCRWHPDTDKCPEDCPYLEIIYIGGEPVLGDCMALCVYEAPDICPHRPKGGKTMGAPAQV